MFAVDVLPIKWLKRPFLFLTVHAFKTILKKCLIWKRTIINKDWKTKMF